MLEWGKLRSDKVIYYSPKAIAYGKKLRRQRLLKGLTQAQLSFETQIAAQFISKFERGARYPWKSAREKLNRFFGIDIEGSPKVDLKKLNRYK